MKHASIFCVSALLLAAPCHAQDVDRDMRAQDIQHDRMQRDVAIQHEQADRMHDDAMRLQDLRARCRAEMDPARTACERQVQVEKARKQADTVAFRQDKAIHQTDAARLEAMHRKTRADKAALEH